MKRIITLVLAIAIAAPLAAQTTVVRVTKKANANAQLGYARALIWKVKAAGNPQEKQTAVANAAASLIAVGSAWPNDRAAVIEANALLAQLYVDGEMPHNAVETAERGLAVAPDDHRLHAAAGRSFAKLGKKSEAAAAFIKAVEAFQPGREDMMASLSAMNAAAYFFEKEKQHNHAASALRHAAALQGLTPMVRVTLRARALEQADLSGDQVKAKDDLDHLREARRVALGTSLTVEQRELLTTAEKTIARHEKNEKKNKL